VAGSHVIYNSFGVVTSGTPGRYAYTGREWDADAGMYYYRARWYDANVGRFISQDPKGFDAGDANVYRYVGNSSPNAEDPTGMQTNNGFLPMTVQSSTPAQLVNQRILPSMDNYVRTSDSVWNEAKGRIAEVYGASTGTDWNASVAGTTYGTLVTKEYHGKVGYYADRNIQIANSAAEAQTMYRQQIYSNAQASGWEYTGAVTVGALSGAGTGIKNVVVGTGKAVREVGYQAADLANTTGYLISGHEMYHGNLSGLGQASMSDDFSYGQHVVETGANMVTFGVYGEGKLTYQYATGQIDLQSYSEGMGASGVFQIGAAYVMKQSQVQARPSARNGMADYKVWETEQHGAVAENPKYSDARPQVRIRAFDDQGDLLSGHATVDTLARTTQTGQPMGFDYKLGSEVSNPLKGQQAAHYPNLARNGGIVVSKNAGPAFGYMQQLPPTPVNIVRPPMYIPAGGYVAGSVVANTPGHH